jgi:hypothetical protein
MDLFKLAITLMNSYDFTKNSPFVFIFYHIETFLRNTKSDTNLDSQLKRHPRKTEISYIEGETEYRRNFTESHTDQLLSTLSNLQKKPTFLEAT